MASLRTPWSICHRADVDGPWYNNNSQRRLTYVMPDESPA